MFNLLIHLFLGLLLGVVFLGAIMAHQNYDESRKNREKNLAMTAGALNILAIAVAFGVLILVMKIVRSFIPLEWQNLLILVLAWVASMILGGKYLHVNKYKRGH